MSQTVEFEYGIGDRVRVRDDAGSFAGEKGIVLEATQTSERHIFKVMRDGAELGYFRSFHLEPDVAEPEAPAPAPTFPRVIWQDEKGAFPRRVVQTALSDLIAEELRHSDAMGAELWTSVAMESDWLTDALVCLALSVTKPAK